jgi:hypothetical protein
MTLSLENEVRIMRQKFDYGFGSVLLTILLLSGASMAQQRPGPREVSFKIVSAEATRFDKPVRIGAGKRAIEYQEALVLKLQVNREEFDSLPPDIEPFLYIGTNEYHVFNIDRKDESAELILTFHVRDWQRVQDGALMVLTTDHGGPIRNPEKYRRQEGVRFSKSLITRQP